MAINPEDWPEFDATKVYVMTGKTLNLLGRLLKAIAPIKGRGISIKRTELGRRVSVSDASALIDEVPTDPAARPAAFGGMSSGSSVPNGSSGASGGGSLVSSTVPSVSSGSSSISSGSSLSSDSGSSSKEANVPFGDEFIAWVCAERPEAIFSDVVVFKLQGPGGFAVLTKPLDSEFEQSIEPGSALVVELAADHFCRLAAFVKDGVILVHVWCLGVIMPSTVTVKVQGVRKGYAQRWKRRSPAEVEANQEFWSAAREIV